MATDVQAHARDRSEHTDLTAARGQLSVLHTDLAVTTYTNDVTTSHRDSLQASVATTLDQLASTERTISGTDGVAYLQDVNVETLETCLGGVQDSFDQIAAHDNNQAAHDISGVAGACTTLAGGGGDGLVYPFDFPDPFVLTVGGTYYAYATNSVAGNIQIIQSSDLTHWTAVGDALPQLPPWATPDETWAPAVVQLGGTFVLYYAVRVAGPGGGEECISVATASQPQGPFDDTSTGPARCASRPWGAPSTRPRWSTSTEPRTWSGSRTVVPVPRPSGPSSSIRPGPASPPTPPRHSCWCPTSRGRRV